MFGSFEGWIREVENPSCAARATMYRSVSWTFMLFDNARWETSAVVTAANVLPRPRTAFLRKLKSTCCTRPLLLSFMHKMSQIYRTEIC